MIFKKRYIIRDWRGNFHSMTAKRLYKRVMRDSQSDYNWIASATELVRVCTEPQFPKEYAEKIQIAILNCFANLETKKEISSNRLPTDSDAVNYCYNSLANCSREATKARQKYLRAVIESIPKYHSFASFNQYGPTYHRICKEWKKIKFEEYYHIPSLDFKKLRRTLDDDFDMTMRTAEKKGAFQEDAEKHHNELRKILAFMGPDAI